MGQLGFAGEDKNLSTYFTIGGEKGIGRAAVDQNDRRLQPPDQFLQAALKILMVGASTQAAIGADRDGFSRLDSVKAEGIGPFITPADIGDYGNAVYREPVAQRPPAVGVPCLHNQRHIPVQAEIGGDDPGKPFQPRQIRFGVVPQAFEPAVVGVKVNPEASLRGATDFPRSSHRLFEGDQPFRQQLRCAQTRDFQLTRIPGVSHHPGVEHTRRLRF